MKKILFVCLGNICRSPIAEGVFQHLVNEAGLSQTIKTDSAGTASYHIGELPDKRARQICEERGIKLTHRARAFSKNDFETFDYILAMDKQNLANILKLKPNNAKSQIMLIRDFDTKHKGSEVPDPYYGELDGFVKVFEMLDRSCEELLKQVNSAIS